MQERTFDRTKVQKPIVIEVGGEPLGVVVADEAGYRFLAVKLPAFAIDGQTYNSVEKARTAASELMRQREVDAA
ncbi:hypothetical protein PSQ19_16025 [Devosia algicola]|uniref:Prevent-host-death protein n=1 Tax=Devosia algicola TaxID=3026418 RepID=A0ABY7YLL0_9HYPH|nr:hypothetical protein [Devosia algicola]WDR02148.1 hypothetical protein PSQ19_16025 [Devosia algicola]